MSSMRLETKVGDAQSSYLTFGTLRHSASFSCLSRNISCLSDKSYRARTATLSAVDLDYGFVIRPDATTAQSCQLPAAHDRHSYSPTQESIIGDIEATATKSERPNLLRKILIKKSVSLLNPHVWWTPKFRRVKSGKSKDKNLQEIQTHKRWRSLGALLKVSHSGNPHSLNMPQSSLPAQSFYLLDDFLKPSVTHISCAQQNSNCVVTSLNSLEASSGAATVSGQTQCPRNPESSNVADAECDLCTHEYRDGGSAFAFCDFSVR